MDKILIISSSIRKNRNSHRVALFLEDFIKNNSKCEAQILDLNEYNLPLYEERKRFLNPIPNEVEEIGSLIESSAGVIIIAPEYNGGYPASLKNVIDLYYDEWYHKPVSFVCVSAGDFGGSQVLQQLQFILWKMKAWTVATPMMVPRVSQQYDESGKPTNSELSTKTASAMWSEMEWAISCMRK